MKTFLLFSLLCLFQDSPNQDWLEVAPENAGAKVMMPSNPLSTVRDFDVVKGRPKVIVNMNIAQSSDKKLTFVYAYHDHFEEVKNSAQKKKILDGAVQGARARVVGELVTNKDVRHRGQPGREFTVFASAKDDKTLKIKGRVYLVGKRLYQISVVSWRSDFNDLEADRFLNSFRLETTSKKKPAKNSQTKNPDTESDNGKN